MSKPIDRRDFLKMMAAGSCACCASTLTGGLTFGLSSAFAEGAASKKLVVLYLNGGWDSLYAMWPNIGALNDRRPTLSSIVPSLLPLGSSNMGFNPVLTTLKAEFDAGHLAVVNKVGYDHQSGSHSDSREAWNRATGDRLQPGNKSGWLARLSEGFFTTNFNAFDFTSGSTLYQGTKRVTTLGGRLINFRFSDSGADATRARGNLFTILPGFASTSNESDALQNAYSLAEQSEARIVSAANDNVFATSYPNTSIGRAFADINRLFRNIPEARVASLQQGGFDTHGNQAVGMSARLQQINDSLGAFIANMRSEGMMSDTCIVIFSEFGRKITENGNKGTDHGRSSHCLILGDSISGGIKGPDYVAADFASSQNVIPPEVNLVNVLGSVVAKFGVNPNTIFPAYNSQEAIII